MSGVAVMLGLVCGRYASSAGAEEVVEAFDVERDETGGELVPSYNRAPTQRAAAVLTRAGEGEDEPVRQLRLLTWGLVPSWSKDRSGGARMINARSETVLEKRSFQRPVASRRCLVPADGWYEWKPAPVPPAVAAAGDPEGSDAPAARRRAPSGKRPHFMTRRDGAPLALAGVYEFWRDRELPEGDPGSWLVTFAVLTTAAEPELREVHDRMPVVVDPDLWADWLDPATTAPAEVADLLAAVTSAPEGRFSAVEVSTRVGSVRADDPSLVLPLAAS